jgi:hypothetical protein
VAHGGALTDAGFAGDDADAGLGGEPGEGASEALKVWVAVEEALAGGVAWERGPAHAEVVAPAHRSSSGSSRSSPKARSRAVYSSVM